MTEELKERTGEEMSETTSEETSQQEKSKSSEAPADEHVHGPDCDHDHHEAEQPYRRVAAKVGRNDPCTCGSGMKYKKCCGKAG
jgi:uncharacterized protein YecA (UPF0149 family)